jgi:hypothetical protein
MVKQVKHVFFTCVRIPIVLVVNKVCLRYRMKVSCRNTLRMNRTFSWLVLSDIYFTWNFKHQLALSPTKKLLVNSTSRVAAEIIIKRQSEVPKFCRLIHTYLSTIRLPSTRLFLIVITVLLQFE